MNGKSDRGGLFGRGVLKQGDEAVTYRSILRPPVRQEPDLVRWSRESRQGVKPKSEPDISSLYQEALKAAAVRRRFPEAMARSDFEGGKSVSLAPELQAFLSEREPTVDWSKVQVRTGHNAPSSEATTIHNKIFFNDPPSNRPGTPKFENDIFHEITHVPQWASGRLTLPRYVAESLGAAMKYAGRASATYGINPVQKAPPTEDIWDFVPVEQETEKRKKVLLEEYRKEYPDAKARRLFD